MTLIKFLIEQNRTHPGMELHIMSPSSLKLISTVNDMILDMEVDYRYREKYNLPVKEFERENNLLRVWLNEYK